ncbi:hypothetical protein PVA45_06750 [Entomospira entomophila]|uniref:N-acetyltransferase domain-containing protein n=1 Tax=Entomospira entomophila TaxID=2719988 RepID=A0A968GDU3_9SPIO|nr:hypothetical protein [Entomospira entomophilus]NIZ41199.1 hypothetical protein [Entomospira entomophilus]WDI35405.1 hypothetical protein PVA45_06750 [Entomospira entomophilus]
MLLLRTYHDDDLTALMNLFVNQHATDEQDDLIRLKSLLNNNYALVCEELGSIVGFALFFGDQGHIFDLRTIEANAEEILSILLSRIEERANHLNLPQITVNLDIHHANLFTALGFHPSPSGQFLVKKLH